jgi:hypothetical protein
VPCIFRIIALSAVVFLCLAQPSAVASGPAVSDSLYNAHHPRLLFTSADLPALYAKVRDGGHDDDAYQYLRFLAEQQYPPLTFEELLANEWGLNTIPNLGVAAFGESPVDTAAIRLGRDVTVYIAQQYDVDNKEADSGLRLRSLALGYDLFFGDAPESLRTFVRDEINSYMQHITGSFIYGLFAWRPYLANHTAMFSGPLGLAAICLQDEADAQILDDAMTMADTLIDSLLTHQFDPDGSYKEGCLYGAWTLRQIIFYFDARERFDGFKYSDHPRIREAENWFAYEISPEGWGKTNNLNDSPYSSTPLGRHSTYFDWAQKEWNSRLSAWLWEHTAGPQGIDYQTSADKAATALWNLGLPPEEPDSLLPRSQLWLERGLYYFRTGWPGGLGGDDVVFSFFSGKFHGGHAQEDQNHFTLHAYGKRFAIDHGAGDTAKQSEAHNMVFIDGAGQHNAGSSIGTDGRIAGYLLSGFADYIQGDATRAYTTYSEFNQADWPFPGFDWSWGYSGSNPVDFALRNVVVVHDTSTPPYLVIVDDIDKDGTPHEYQWRLHTQSSNTVNVSENPIRIHNSVADLDVHVLHPDFAAMTASTESFDNRSQDPNSTILKLTHNAVNPRFSLLLFPSSAAVNSPVVSRENYLWGFAGRLDWGGGLVDVILGNHTGGTVTWGADSVQTDASLAVVRAAGSVVVRHLIVDATQLRHLGVEYVRIFDGPVTCALEDGVIHLDREDAAFRIRDTGIDRVVCRDADVPFVRHNGYLYGDELVAIRDRVVPPQTLEVAVFPNPFNPTVTIRIDVSKATRLRVAVYDAAGREVNTLSDRFVGAGRVTLRWEGTNRYGRPVPSGVYFLKVTADGLTSTKKLTVIK